MIDLREYRRMTQYEKKPRPSYEAAVAELYHIHPEKSVREMAKELALPSKWYAAI